MMKRTITAAALAVVLAAPAFAQTATPPAATAPSATQSSTSAGGNFVSSEQSTDWRASKLIGATVYGSDNASIGEVNELLLASDGKVNGVIIGVGGFLGVGGKNVGVTFDKLNVSKKPDGTTIDKITVNFSKDELKNAPAFAYNEPVRPATTTGSSPAERPRGTAPMGGGTTPSAPAR